MSRTQLCPRTKIHIILFHLSPSPSTDSRRAWLNPKYLLHPPNRPPPFLFNDYPSIPNFSPLRDKKFCPSPSLHPLFSFFLPLSLPSELHCFLEEMVMFRH